MLSGIFFCIFYFLKRRDIDSSTDGWCLTPVVLFLPKIHSFSLGFSSLNWLWGNKAFEYRVDRTVSQESPSRTSDSMAWEARWADTRLLSGIWIFGREIRTLKATGISSFQQLFLGASFFNSCYSAPSNCHNSCFYFFPEI